MRSEVVIIKNRIGELVKDSRTCALGFTYAMKMRSIKDTLSRPKFELAPLRYLFVTTTKENIQKEDVYLIDQNRRLEFFNEGRKFYWNHMFRATQRKGLQLLVTKKMPPTTTFILSSLVYLTRRLDITIWMASPISLKMGTALHNSPLLHAESVDDPRKVRFQLQLLREYASLRK